MVTSETRYIDSLDWQRDIVILVICAGLYLIISTSIVGYHLHTILAKKANSLTLKIEECSEAGDGHVVHCTVVGGGLTNIDYIIPSYLISRQNDIGYCKSNTGQALRCTIHNNVAQYECLIINDKRCTRDLSCRIG